jgi:hypothetical protein
MTRRTFLVEAYAGPGGDADASRLRDACAGGVAGVGFVGMVRVPTDETTFYLLEADDEAAVGLALQSARVLFDRVVPAEASGLTGDDARARRS